MKSFWNNYKSSIVLLGAILLGGIVGATMGEKAVVLKPIGELFLNLLFMTLVPLVFFSVTSAIANMGGGMQRLGKILKSIVIVFLGTALVAAVIGLVGVLLMNPTKGLDTSLFKDIISSANDSSATEKVGLLQQIVNTFTVNDFSLLLSRSNMLQLIVFSILFGIGTLMAAESGKSIAKFVQSGSAVMMKDNQYNNDGSTNRTWMLLCKCYRRVRITVIIRVLKSNYIILNINSSNLLWFIYFICIYSWWKRWNKGILVKCSITNSYIISNLFKCSFNTCKLRCN